MGSKQALMHLFYQMASLKGIYASKQSCIVVPLLQDFPIQEELARHVLDKFPLIVHGSWVFTILDIMVPWLLVGFSFDVHAIGRHTTDLYAQLSHLISFCQFNHTSQGC